MEIKVEQFEEYMEILITNDKGGRARSGLITKKQWKDFLHKKLPTASRRFRKILEITDCMIEDVAAAG